MTASSEAPSKVENELVLRSCPICEASCGLRIYVDKEAKSIERIEGDPDDFRSRGY